MDFAAQFRTQGLVQPAVGSAEAGSDSKGRDMRKLIVSTFLTLDGVMQAPGGPEEDTDVNFALGGWSVNYWDDKMGEVMDAAMSQSFDLRPASRTKDL